MLTLFPNLLVYGFFAPTLLRITAAATMLYIAWYVVNNRKHLMTLQYPIVGRPHEWLIWFSVTVLALDGLFLLIGLYTQWAAIIAAIIALKQAFFPPRLNALPRSSGFLLLVIALSLLVTGAGALAFDLPL